MAKLKIIQYPLKNNRCYQQNVKRAAIGIQLHTIGCAQGTAKAVADYWNQSAVNCCTTYICDADEAGKVYQFLEEDVYSWADAGFGNRNLITFEIAESDFMKYNENGTSFVVTDKEKFRQDILRGYDTAVLLCADICKRHKWNPLSKLSNGLYLISSHDEGRRAGLSSAHVDPTHVWTSLGLSMNTFRQAVANAMRGDYEVIPSETEVKWFRVRKTWENEKSQLGAYETLENAKAACPYLYSVFDSNGKQVYKNATKPVNTQAKDFQALSEGKAAEKILELVHLNDKSGILYSVTAAQMILESGYVKTELARSANNCFGMKCTLSGNTWASAWDGKSKVNIRTPEEYNGSLVYIYADFRKYPCIEDSIKDHSAYLLGAMNGSKKRYEGLTACKNYKDAITLIKKGGYATDSGYVAKICSIIQRYGLDRYDKEIVPQKDEPAPTPVTAKQYGVQSGAYKTEKYLTQHVKKLEELGFKKGKDFQVKVMSDGQSHVILGVYKIKVNAENKAASVWDKYKIKTTIIEI